MSRYIGNCVSVDTLTPSGALRLSALCETHPGVWHAVHSPRFYKERTYFGYDDNDIVGLCRDFVLSLRDEGYFVVGSDELMELR